MMIYQFLDIAGAWMVLYSIVLGIRWLGLFRFVDAQFRAMFAVPLIVLIVDTIIGRKRGVGPVRKGDLDLAPDPDACRVDSRCTCTGCLKWDLSVCCGDRDLSRMCHSCMVKALMLNYREGRIIYP